MHIAINSLLFSPGRMGGVEVYFRNLLAALANRDHTNDYTIFLPPVDANAVFVPNRRFKIYSPPKPSPTALLPYRILNKISRSVFKQQPRRTPPDDWLSNHLNQQRPDVTHHPFGFMYPLEAPASATVLTFWDMQHEYYPQFFSEGELQLRKKLYRASVDAAAHIIAPSQFTKASLVERYQVAPHKISVVYFGLDPDFPTAVSKQRVEQLRAKYQLSETLIFYPAATYTHKNHIRLIEAFRTVALQFPNAQLILTGAAMSADQQVDEAIRVSGIGHQIKRLGFVPREEIPVFFAAARLLVFPSQFEGYGIPVLEAMQLGCPVACSNVCSLPELVGDAALTFDPTDITAIADAMLTVLTDDQLSASLVERGFQRSSGFSWPVAADATLRIYESVCSQAK